MSAQRYATSPEVVKLEGDFEHHMVHTRGIRLHVAVAGKPSDPLVLLIHGTFGGWFDFKDVIAPLAAAGYHVAAMDMRGYGMSDKPPQTPGDELRIATGDVVGVVSSLGHSKAILVGHDTGGTVAWACSTHYPDRVQALVSVAAAHPTDLRAAVIRRPWDFMPNIARIAMAQLPSQFLSRLTTMRRHTWRKVLEFDTLARFHGTKKFHETLELRLKAADIGHAMPYIVHNSRLLTPRLPVTFQKDAKVTAPTLLIHPKQKLWNPIVTMSRERVDAPVEELIIDEAKNLPQIEQPERFVAHLANYFKIALA
ncbi:alpha/beta fold hydrolase [Corynebacterium sp. S7]